MRRHLKAALCGAAALVLLIAGASDSLAEQKTFSWDAPMSYEDGTPLPLADVAAFRVQCGRTAGGPYDAYTGTTPGNAMMLVDDFTGQGDWYCVAFTVATNGLDSAPSNEVFFTIATRPAAPLNFSVD